MKNIFKYLMFAAFSVAAIEFFTACGDDDPVSPPEPPEPSVDEPVEFTRTSDAVYYGDAKDNSLGFYSLTLANDDNVLCLGITSSLTSDRTPVPDAGEYVFSAERTCGSFDDESYWLSSGDGVDITRRFSSGKFTLSAAAGGYRIEGSVVCRDGETLDFVYEGALVFSDVSNEPAPDAIPCMGAYGTYYGSYYIPDAADYYLVIYDTVHSNSGDAYNYRICLDFTSSRPSGGKIMPAMGTYRVDEEGTFAEGTFVAGMMNGIDGTLWQVPSSNGGSSRYMVTDGFFTIREADGNRYQIFGTLKDSYGSEISFDYVGALSFDNDAAGVSSSLTTDYDMGEAFYANQKCYETSPEGNLWNIWFYDEDAWTTKGMSGYFFRFDILLEPGLKSIPAGEYGVAAHSMKLDFGEYIPGYIFAGSAAYGSWLAKGTGSSSVCHAPLRGGSLVLTCNDDGTYTAAIDVIDDNYIPKRMTGSFTGEIPITSDSEIKTLSAPTLSGRSR